MKKVKKIDALSKLSGSALFINDYYEENMLNAMFLYSKISHGKIKNVIFPKEYDLKEFIIVDAKDIPGKNLVENPVMDLPLFAQDEINFIGQPILAVAHKDKKTVFDFINKIKVEYEEFPAKIFYKETLEDENNAFPCPKELISDPFKSEIIINNHKEKPIDPTWIKLHNVYYTPHQEQLYLEPQGAYAKYDVATKSIFVKISCQCPFYVHEAIEIFFGKEANKVEIEVPDNIGGAFGGKEDYPNIIAGVVALLSYKSKGKTVKIVFDRDDDINITTKRHPSRTEITSYTNPKTKKLEKLIIDFRLDAGAYQTLSPVVLARGTLHAAGVYKCDDVYIKGRLFKSNTPPNGAFRGFGAPQSMFALESHVEEISSKLNIPSLEFRKINMFNKEDSHPTTQKVDIESAKEAIDKIVKLANYEEKIKEYAKFNKQNNSLKKGIGLSVVMHGGGFTGTGERVINSKIKIEINKKAIVKIFVSSTDMGQGAATTLAQCFAEEINHSFSKTLYQTPNTTKTPNSGPTVASRTIYIVGNMLRKLAKDIKNELKFTSLEDFVKENQEMFPKFFHASFEMDPNISFDVAKYYGTAYKDYSWAACIAEIEYDCNTYSVNLKKLWNVLDIGKLINKEICEGQIQGGAVQGAGYALTEYIERNNMRGKSITDYVVPTSLDAPELIVDFINEDSDLPKGLGEIPMNFPAPAIRNAFYNATGIFMNEIPLVPESIMKNQ